MQTVELSGYALLLASHAVLKLADEAADVILHSVRGPTTQLFRPQFVHCKNCGRVGHSCACCMVRTFHSMGLLSGSCPKFHLVLPLSSILAALRISIARAAYLPLKLTCISWHNHTVG
jgi:hypothetical protein